MKSRSFKGFTLVELLIVIVIIAILAAIAIVTYSGITVRAANTARTTQAVQIVKLFELYKAHNGNWPKPSSPGTYYCVGTGYPNGKCRDFTSTGPTAYLETNVEVINMLKEVGTPPTGGYQPVSLGSYSTVGPYVYYSSTSTYINLVVSMQGEDVSVCPPGFGTEWADPSSALYNCSKRFTY